MLWSDCWWNEGQWKNVSAWFYMRKGELWSQNVLLEDAKRWNARYMDLRLKRPGRLKIALSAESHFVKALILKCLLSLTLLAVTCCLCTSGVLHSSAKGQLTVHPKMRILSSFSHLSVITDTLFFSFMKKKRRRKAECPSCSFSYKITNTLVYGIWTLLWSACWWSEGQ